MWVMECNFKRGDKFKLTQYGHYHFLETINNFRKICGTINDVSEEERIINDEKLTEHLKKIYTFEKYLDSSFYTEYGTGAIIDDKGEAFELCNVEKVKMSNEEWVSSLPELKLTDEQMAGLEDSIEEFNKGEKIVYEEGEAFVEDMNTEDGNNFNIGDVVYIASNDRMKENQTIFDAISREIIIGISVKITYREAYNDETNNYGIGKDIDVNYIFKENDRYSEESEYEIDEEYVFATEEEALAYLRNDDDFRSMNPHLIGLDEE